MESLNDILKQNGLPIGCLSAEIADWSNIYDSFDYVVSHLECAQQRNHLRPKRDCYCRMLKKLLSSGEFRIGDDDFRTMVVKDGPKARTVQAPSVFHRVGCHAVMVPFEKYAYATLIDNTAASIKHRGMHWLHNIIEEDLLADAENTYFYYQCDIYHYYDSINQDLMKQQVREYTTDPLVLPMLDNFISLLDEGLSKGLRASQCLANLHLSDVDHEMCKEAPYHITEEGEVRHHYYRYCDDIVIIAKTKKELWRLRDSLVAKLARLGLTIKPTEAVRPLTSGLDYLGYKTFVDDSGAKRAVYSYIRKRTKQKFARRITRVKSRKRRVSLIGSFFGMAAHGDCRNLLKKLITPTEYKKLKHTRKMKDFGNFDIKPTTFNGKKSFKGTNISSGELDRKGIVVVDYETDLIPTWAQEEYNKKLQEASIQGIDDKLVQKPKPKTVMSIIYDGKLRKLWTGDKEILEILQQIDSDPDGFPFFVGIEIDYAGRYKKINFVDPKKLNLTRPSDQEIDRILEMYNIKLNKSA